MGQFSNRTPSERDPIPTKIGSKIGGEFTYPKMVPLVSTHHVFRCSRPVESIDNAFKPVPDLKSVDIPPAVGGRGVGGPAPNSIYLAFPISGNMETRNGFPGVTPLPQFRF